MARLPIGQAAVVMPSYPHMLAGDIEVWTEYLKSPIVPIEKVWYDVHVGATIPVAAEQPDFLRTVAAGVGRKRIDVICKVRSGLWVIEVKPFGDMVALGQVITYRNLFAREYEGVGAPEAVVVCGQADDDVVLEYRRQGVMVIAV